MDRFVIKRPRLVKLLIYSDGYSQFACFADAGSCRTMTASGAAFCHFLDNVKHIWPGVGVLGLLLQQIKGSSSLANGFVTQMTGKVVPGRHGELSVRIPEMTSMCTESGYYMCNIYVTLPKYIMLNYETLLILHYK